MSLKLLIDMNLSVDWVDVLTIAGYSAIHWSTIGDYRADDELIMEWAKEHGYIVFTHDLDFGHLLALSQEDGPSVLQVRAKNILPTHLGTLVLATLRQYQTDLSEGALVVVDSRKARVRVLPITSRD